ncbi:MAG: rRNA maturation RNase YbeY [Synergistota bacterium]|nr:rRNA maturation RNase YbeY [Synergistota bacterium]
MKVQMRLESSGDADPDAAAQELAARAEEVFARALERMFPEGALPPRAEVSLSFLPLERMREQNRTYRGIDEPTDVLSFPLWEEDGEFRPSCALPVLPLGDILICPEYVRSCTPDEDAFNREMALLVSHGFLHLLGWDHDNDEREAKMSRAAESLQNELLAGHARGFARLFEGEG